MASTKSKWNRGSLQFSNHPLVSKGSTLSANAEFDSTTEAAVFTSDTFPGGFFNATDMHFKLTLAGHISSDGSDDLTLKLKFGATTLLTLTTVALPNEDDKAFKVEFIGRVHTTGASGKMVAHGIMSNAGTGMADLKAVSPVAGVSVDLTADSTLNVTADWDDDDATTDIFILMGLLELFN